MLNQKLKIAAPNGLGSRHSASLVFEANKFDCDIHLKHGQDLADAKSIMNVMALVIRQGEEFELHAKGKDEDKAMTHLLAHLKKIQLV
jgi:phosphotransferase system HPr (HPr) family protein